MKTLFKVKEIHVICQLAFPEPNEIQFRVEVLQCSRSGDLIAQVYRLEECTFLVESGGGIQGEQELATHQVWVLDNFAWDPWQTHKTNDVENFGQSIINRLRSFEEGKDSS